MGQTSGDKMLSGEAAVLKKDCHAIYSETELTERLAGGKVLRVKFGMDPTAPDVHLGHAVQLDKVRLFQDLGHKAVLIIGDYTARIGDPSGVNKTRPVLSPEQIRSNAQTYVAQAAKVLDTSPEKLEIRYNSEWLAKMDLAEVLKLASQMTVARMMERDTFEQRFKAGVPIGVHEFLYPLMQGYDSVCVRADVEIGGTDQTFNNLIGRQLQENAGMAPQVVMIFPLLVGLDGKEKMSKSKGNYVGVTDKPNDMFGKIMSIPDELMASYYQLLTPLPAEQIATLSDAKKTHPRQAKAELAKLIVARFHDDTAASAAAAEFDRIFAKKNVPTDMPEIFLQRPSSIGDVMVEAGFAVSNKEAKRLIQQNAVSIDDKKITDITFPVSPDTHDGAVLKVGKRRFGKFKRSR